MQIRGNIDCGVLIFCQLIAGLPTLQKIEEKKKLPNSLIDFDIFHKISIQGYGKFWNHANHLWQIT